MFRGATLVNLDRKGRIDMPTRHREKLNEKSAGLMVYTIHLHQASLLLYPLPDWKIIEQKLSRLSTMNPVERRVQRLLLGYASECQMNGTVRIWLSPTLRHHAKLSKEGMVVEQINEFELWDEQSWYQQIKDDIDAELSAELALTDQLQDLSL